MRPAVCSLALLAALGAAATAGEPARTGPKPFVPEHDPVKLAARIDALIEAGWASHDVKAAPLTNDGEFLRRVSLDVAGRIPRAFEVQDFLDDPAPDKRRRFVDELLAGPAYVSHFTNVWRALYLPQTNNPQLQLQPGPFEEWLRQQLRANTPYDKMVRQLLAVPRSRRGGMGEPASPRAFYDANELKPENVAAATSRLFMGIKLECAQCHNHPFASWKRQQFWEFAAFFSGIQPLGRNAAAAATQETFEPGEIRIPGIDEMVKARYLDGTRPDFDSNENVPGKLAEWLTRPDNPYFARAAVNRLWAHFFGIGLCDPVDEMGPDNPPSHPELLDELARQFVVNHFDVKFMIRALIATRAYQRSSIGPPNSEDDPRLFARVSVKGLTPEQLYESLIQATGYREQEQPSQQPTPFGTRSLRQEFLSRFAPQEKKTEYQTSILQALALMNGKLIRDVTSVERSETLAAVVDAPFLTPARRVETLYMAALTRKPRPDELERMVKYIEGSKDQKAALADVFWALLNSSEFILNH